MCVCVCFAVSWTLLLKAHFYTKMKSVILPDQFYRQQPNYRILCYVFVGVNQKLEFCNFKIAHNQVADTANKMKGSQATNRLTKKHKPTSFTYACPPGTTLKENFLKWNLFLSNLQAKIYLSDLYGIIMKTKHTKGEQSG